MPGLLPVSSTDEVFRGRNRSPKCLFSRYHSARKNDNCGDLSDEDWQDFGKEWSTIWEEEEVGSSERCGCGYATTERKAQLDNLIHATMKSYPSYLCVADCGGILVKGSTSQSIMRCFEEGLPTAKIPRCLIKLHPMDRFSVGEVQSLIKLCSLSNLGGQSPLATESWENESIECWWLQESSYCAMLRREQPIDDSISGYDCNNGWWKDKQCGEKRNWSIYGYRSIGPEEQRRKQSQLYDLYGSDALRSGEYN